MFCFDLPEQRKQGYLARHALSRIAGGADAHKAGWSTGQRGVRLLRVVVQVHSEQAEVEPLKVCMSKSKFSVYVVVYWSSRAPGTHTWRPKEAEVQANSETEA